jgi:tetratricopeptide (TPR) repeat protein
MQQYEKRTHGGLRALCLSDWGEMLSKQGKPELSYERFRRAWEDLTKSSPPDAEPPELFHLNCLCREADGHRAFENWDPAHACMTEALAIADRLGERQPDHPMRALFYERSGWYHVDVWRINEAEADFRKALKIRTANYEQNNLLALHFVYRNRQGRAMADYFQGNASQGGAVLKTILEEINTKDIPRKQLDELKSRRPNLLERVADTALADPEGGDDPIKYLREAIRIAQGKPDDFRRDGRRTTLARLIYKAAVATAMLGSRSDAATLREQGDEEVKAFAARQQELAQKAGRIPTENVPTVRPVYEMSQELATACVTLVDTDPRVRDKGREDLLRQFEKNPNEIGRDDLLLLLFVGEQVLRGDAFDKKLKNLVARYLEKMAEIKPKRGPIGGALMDRSGEGPKLFQRYLRLAMEYPRTA